VIRVLAALVLVLSGCESCEDDEPVGEGGGEGRASSVLEGTVRLAEGAELPLWPANPLVEPTPRPPIPDTCTPPQESDRRPVRLAEGRGLAGVMVAIGQYDRAVEHEPVTHELVIRDCRLQPSIVVGTAGDTLRITNETEGYHFMPHLGIPGPLTAILSGQSREIVLGRGGHQPIVCGFLAPCGRTDVMTAYGPLHAVTDEHGHYVIEQIPAGDEVTITAWHPLFNQQDQTATLEAAERRTLDFVLAPAPAPPPRPQPPPPAEQQGGDILF
jgi:hypothetical protein